MSKQINEHKLNADFLIVPFAKQTSHYMKMQVFLFSSFNVMNAKNKLSALNRQKKCILLSRNEEYKQQFLFWRKNEEFNNNFSYQETNNLRQFPFQKKMDLMRKWKYFEINSSMIKKNALNKHWTNFSFKGGRGR